MVCAHHPRLENRRTDNSFHIQNASNSMSVKSCLSFCGTDKYAGLEYSRECWCAPDLNSHAAKLLDAKCDLPCSGNGTEACGGALT